MRRTVIGVVIVAMGLVIGAPAVEALQWDPDNPPPWIPVEATSTRPSGDDGGWGNTERSLKAGYIWWQLDLWVWKWIISPYVSGITEPLTPEPTVVTEGVDEGSSAPTGNR